MNDAADMFAPLPELPEQATATTATTRGPDWLPELPAPKEPPATLPPHRHGAPVSTWTYRSADGLPLFVVARFEKPGGKEILPLTFGALDGRLGWYWKAPPMPAPLYGLPDLAARPDAPVVVVEGEKAADAAAHLLPSHVAVTWQGGCNAVAKADWRALAGRRVSVWPDHDEPGRKAAAEVERACRGAGAASVAVVEIPTAWPAKWDLADALPPGVSVEVLFTMLAEAEREVSLAAALPAGFRLTREGLFYAPPGEPDAAPLHICGTLRIEAATHDGAGQAWGALLHWADADGAVHRWAMPRQLLAGDGTEVRARLLDGGLFVAPGRKARERLAEYLARATPAERVRVVARIGWHDLPSGRAFVLPDGALYSTEAGRVMLQTERPEALPPLVQSGSLEDWQREVASHAAGNTRLAFALACAFAAPLMHLAGGEGGGFHLRGGSSLGKTTALQAAGSVWGGGGLRGWVRSWRTTDNALEAVAAAHCDLLMCMDEMGEASPEAVKAGAYMLANGAGKGRANERGSARRVAAWRVLFLSTGEVGLADLLAEARGGPVKVRAGQEVRVLDIPAEAGPHGLFEHLAGFASAGALADHLKAAAGRYHGTAGRAWLERLAAEPERFAAEAREVVNAFLAKHVPKGAAGQVGRAAGRFALVAAAGELATRDGLLPWKPGDAERAAAACFAAWRGARAGGDGAAEDAAALAMVRAFLGAHGESRFQTVSGQGDAAEVRLVVNRAGWRKQGREGWRYCILPETWRREVVAGLDPEAAAKALRRAGHLVPQSDSAVGHGRMERVGEPQSVRVYVIKGTILSDPEP